MGPLLECPWAHGADYKILGNVLERVSNDMCNITFSFLNIHLVAITTRTDSLSSFEYCRTSYGNDYLVKVLLAKSVSVILLSPALAE